MSIITSQSPPVEAFEQALLTVNHIAAKEIFNHYAKEHSPFTLVENLFVPVMDRIGQGWENGDLALSQVYMSGQICSELADHLQWGDTEKPWPQCRMAICVLEDYHMLGKQMVYSALRASGYDLLDYGRMDVDPLAERVKKDKIQLLMVSTLMLRAAMRIKVLRERLNADGMNIQLVVGGAPFRFDTELWQEVGADAMAFNTSDALSIVRRMS
ncbi:cobalamin B12-binding domain-containing protein [Magnetococcales bacterium HHB-1]